MAASNPGAATNTADREIVITRLFDAPRTLVFEAWTHPEHVARWWGPNGFTTTISEMNVKPGGDWRLVMHGPDGRDYINHIVFVEVVEPRLLVYQHEPEPGTEPVNFQTTVAFAEQGEKTLVTLHMLFPTAAVHELVVTHYHAIEGGQQTLGRLAGYLPSMSAADDLVLQRTFDAPRERIWQAWTQAEHLQRWWGPKDFTNPVCQVDVRPGGAILIHMRAPNGVVYPMGGVFHEVEPPSRLVFSSYALDPAGNHMFEVLNTVTFEEHSGKTRLTLRAKVTMQTDVAPQYLKGMEQGWSMSLDRLASTVA